MRIGDEIEYTDAKGIKHEVVLIDWSRTDGATSLYVEFQSCICEWVPRKQCKAFDAWEA